MIPDKPIRGTHRAETRIFELFAACPENWVVFHGIPRGEKTTGSGRTPGGETDFIVLIPGVGWLVLEVKGETVGYKNGRWVREGKRGSQSLRETPMQQARSNAYDMRTYIRETDPSCADYPFFWTVAFLSERIESPEHSESNTILSRDCYDASDFELGILRVINDAKLNFDQPRIAPRAIDVERLVCLFQTRIQTDTAMVLVESEREFVRLSEEQNSTLWGAGLVDKVLIEGPAGSGKTILAMHMARQAGERGLRTLVLTDTLGQREWLQIETYGIAQLTVDIDTRWIDNLTRRRGRGRNRVQNRLERLRNLSARIEGDIKKIERGGDEKKDARQQLEERDEILTELIDQAFKEMVEEHGELPWDLLIWDEFQDYRYPRAARRIVREFRRVKIFADFQRQDWLGAMVGRDLKGELIEEFGTTPEKLMHNNRNSANIADAATKLTHVPTGPTFAGDGLPVEIHYHLGDPMSDDPEAVEELNGILISRVNELKSTMGTISGRIATIIDNGHAVETAFRWQSTIGDFPIRRMLSARPFDAEPSQSHVCFADVASFKGLESPVVFLIYPEPIPLPDEPIRHLINYSALTRARSLLCIFTPEGNRPFFEQRLPEALHFPKCASSN